MYVHTHTRKTKTVASKGFNTGSSFGVHVKNLEKEQHSVIQKLQFHKNKRPPASERHGLGETLVKLPCEV